MLRFTYAIMCDENGMPRDQNHQMQKQEIQAIVNYAHHENCFRHREMAGDSFPRQIISDEGELDAAALQLFSDSVKLHDCGISYAVVAIMGPQSSGKSTLLNSLFGTNFSVMDAEAGRKQTTKGIWIAKGEGIEPLTLVMDLEGADSGERADQADPTFEKRIAMFALAVANILVINIWCHDIGREAAANRPLLRAVFQGMMRMFGPRKTTLLYVIRDKTETHFEYLENMLRVDIQKIWKTIPKPPAYKDTPLSEFFNVEVTALPSYKYEKEKFKGQVAQRRQFFMHSTSPEGLACNRQDRVVPASAFCSNINHIWETIKQDQDLDLPALGILVANLRCEEIANEMLNRLASDEDWVALEQAVDADPGAVLGFGKSATTALNKYLSEYDAESQFFDDAVRNEKRQNLKSKALKEVVYPCYKKLLRHLSSVSFERFKIELEEKLGGGETGFVAAVRECHVSRIDDFDRRCSDARVEEANWDASKVRGELEDDIEAHASVVRARKLSELVDDEQKKLRRAVVKPVESLFETGGANTWASIRDFLKRESDKAGSELSSAMAAGFELEQETVDKMVRDLNEYANNLVKDTSRELADHAIDHLKERFTYAIMCDENGMPRDQNHQMKKQEIQSIVNYAHNESLKLLATMAVIRLEEGTVDSVEDLLRSSLMPAGGSRAAAGDPLASNSWDEVPPEKTVITPIQCRVLWKRYIMETEHQTKIAQSLFGKRKRSFWSILGLIVLGAIRFAKLVSQGPFLALANIADFILGDVIVKSTEIPEWYEKTCDYMKRPDEECRDLMEQLKKRLIALYDYIMKKIAKVFGSETASQARSYQPVMMEW